MLLIHTQKVTSRVDYAFKHMCTRILGVKVEFTSVIERFIAHQGPKISYGKQPMGNEVFIHAHGLLTQEGFEDVDNSVYPWGDTIGLFPASEKSALSFDIFAASFYLLTRYEEYIPHLKDELGRFPAEESLAFRENFLNRPVVDIWAYRFKALLLERFPDINIVERKHELHHLVAVSMPYAYANRGFFRKFSGFFRDLGKLRLKRTVARIKVLLKLRKDPFDTFDWIINAIKLSKARLSVFFLLGEGYSYREDINTRRENYRLLVKLVGDYTEVGLLFSYHSLGKEERLKEERKDIEELTHRELECAMNDQLVVNLPHFYRSLLEVEVYRDMTMVYRNKLGFRAGTCTPFLFYDLDYEIKTPLVIHPLAGCTSVLDGMTAGEKEKEINDLREQVKAVNGTFSLMFTNHDFTEDKKFLKQIFTEF